MSVGNEFDDLFASNGLACIPIVGDELLFKVSISRLSGQLKHLIFTKALLYQASQQYETEFTVETPDIHKSSTIPGSTTIQD